MTLRQCYVLSLQGSPSHLKTDAGFDNATSLAHRHGEALGVTEKIMKRTYIVVGCFIRYG